MIKELPESFECLYIIVQKKRISTGIIVAGKANILEKFKVIKLKALRCQMVLNNEFCRKYTCSK